MVGSNRAGQPDRSGQERGQGLPIRVGHIQRCSLGFLEVRQRVVGTEVDQSVGPLLCLSGLADFLAPQDALGVLVLDQAGVDAELEAAGQRPALPVGQEVQWARSVRGVDDAVGEDRDGVLPGECGVLDDLTVQVDAGAGDDRRADVGPPGRAGQGAPRLAGRPALPARALAQLRTGTLDRRASVLLRRGTRVGRLLVDALAALV